MNTEIVSRSNSSNLQSELSLAFEGGDKSVLES